MRTRVIEALTYPRILITAQMDSGDCPMHGYFNPAHQACRDCMQHAECHWLNKNDEFSVLLKQPIDILIDTLSFSIDYVDAHVSRQDHNSTRCACDSCHWIRHARHLVRKHSHSQALD